MSNNNSGKVRDIVYEGGGLPEVTIEKLEAYISSKVNEEVIKEAKKYCDDGHYHDEDRDLAMLPSERLAELDRTRTLRKKKL